MILMQQQILSSVLPEPNTFIGGVGATSVTSVSDFVAITTLSAGNIHNFQIDADDNVSFYVDRNYIINTTAFYNTADITWFIDANGYCQKTTINVLIICPNIKYLKFDNADLSNSSGGRFLHNLGNLLKFAHTNTLKFGHAVFSNTYDLEEIYAPLATLVHTSNNRAGMQNLSSLKRLYIPNCTQYNTAQGCILSLAGINTGVKVYAHPDMQTSQNALGRVDFSNLLSLNDTITINGLVYTAVASPSVDGDFLYHTDSRVSALSLTNAINSDGRTGTLGTVTAFNDTNSLPVYMETDVTGASGNAVTYSSASPGMVCVGSNFTGGGGMDYTLKWIQDVRSGTIIFVDPPISVDPPTSLSASNQTATSVDLNFTPPTPNANGTDAYEVWVDDGTVYRKWFEYDEISASGDTLDLTEVYNDVGTISGTKIKIRTIDGQMNFSEFSNEITLP